MTKLAIVTAIVLASLVSANAQEAPATTTSPTWADVQRACGTEYRDAKGKADRPSWPEFLNECKGRKGFVPKRGAKADFRLPDIQK